MTIIKNTVGSNEAYTNQSWSGNTVPEGYVQLPDELVSLAEQYKYFFTPTFGENGVITAIEDNSTARVAQKVIDDAILASAKIEPTSDDRLAALEAAMLEIALGG